MYESEGGPRKKGGNLGNVEVTTNGYKETVEYQIVYQPIGNTLLVWGTFTK